MLNTFVILLKHLRKPSFLGVLLLVGYLFMPLARADMYEQLDRAKKNPNIELLDAEALQYLEAFTAPGLIFHWSLCDPPRSTADVLCTQLPLDYNKPFTEFPVALRFYDNADAKSVAKYRITNRRDIHDLVSEPHFFLMDMHHGKLDVTQNGDASYTPIDLNTVPVLKAGEHYRSSMAIAKQSGGGSLTFQYRVAVPKGTVLFRPIPLGMWETERKWRKCEGEIVPGKQPSGWLHQYHSGGNCGARFVVNVFGERSGREVTTYVFRRQENFNVGSLYRRLNQTYRISPKDPPGLYTLEWWYAGKMLTRTRFEVKA
jgi:hypothetical protein